ncbi:MAG: glutamyl-tRNA reductase [Mariprofundales bacterium]
MRICHIGLNHRSASIEIRERLAVTEHEIPLVLQKLLATHAIREIALLSTCNRVEFILVTHDPDAAIAVAYEWFAQRANMSVETILEHVYAKTTADAVHHIAAVASGLDSLVLGEPQILGQVKSAYEHALVAETAGHILHRLFQCTFATAKRVRTKTGIGKQAVNISSCAVELARRIFGDLNGSRVLLIGAGEMAELAARHLVGQGVKEILVANRTLERAQKLARIFDGHALELLDLPKYLDAADIVISSTGASAYVLLHDTVSKAMQKRRGKPMFLVDIAVPRDIDPRISDLESVYLYDIDDLQHVVRGNMDKRKAESEMAMTMIDEEVKGFLQWLKSLESVPIIRALQEKTERLRREELQKSKRYMKNMSVAEQQAVERFSIALSKRYMHASMRVLKTLPEDIDGDLLMGAARCLFDLENKEERRQHATAIKENKRGA